MLIFFVNTLPKALLRWTAFSCPHCHLPLCKYTTSLHPFHPQQSSTVLFCFLLLYLLMNAASYFTQRRNIENKNSCPPRNPVSLALGQRQELPFWNPPFPCNFSFGRRKKNIFPCTWWERRERVISLCCTCTDIRLGQRITCFQHPVLKVRDWDKTTTPIQKIWFTTTM